MRDPPASASRHAPTPLVFVSTKKWDKDSEEGITDLASMLTEKGFTTLVTDISVSGEAQSPDMLNAYSRELRSSVKYAMTPFAPVFVSRSIACLVTQKYISSYPATGLVLISPPTSNSSLGDDKLPTELEEFIYEPKFPIAIVDTPKRIEELKAKNRLCREPSPYVDIIAVEKLEGQPLLNAVDKWLDELGI